MFCIGLGSPECEIQVSSFKLKVSRHKVSLVGTWNCCSKAKLQTSSGNLCFSPSSSSCALFFLTVSTADCMIFVEATDKIPSKTKRAGQINTCGEKHGVGSSKHLSELNELKLWNNREVRNLTINWLITDLNFTSLCQFDSVDEWWTNDEMMKTILPAAAPFWCQSRLLPLSFLPCRGGAEIR